MNKKKTNGAYYTPQLLADFIMAYVAPNFKTKSALSLLEPSVGNGAFLRSFNKTSFPESITQFFVQAVEKVKPELEKAKRDAATGRKQNTRFSFIKNDFLKFQSQVRRKYSLIAGNPPYIKKSFLNKTQIRICESIRTQASLNESSIKNIWPYFLIRSVQLLEEDGVLALVLPAELLQVNFSVELRTYLTENFVRTEIFTFDDLLFECKGQDTVLLVAYKQHDKPGQYYTHIKHLTQLVSNEFELHNNTALKETKTKWIHHLLASDDLTLLYKISADLKTVDHFCDSKPGIVTAANNFFIINEETEKLFKLSRFVRPIIQKGFFVNGSVVFDSQEYNQLLTAGKPAKLLCISDAEASDLPFSVREYLEIGVALEIPAGYKCSKRTNWFVVPNIATPPDGFFFRRIHHYPKLIKNAARVLVTDTAYKIEMRKGFEIKDFIYSFYNSLTLTFAELSGRYYGGGVLEVTPQEFKKLPIPHCEIADFKAYTESFEGKKDIKTILCKNDFDILYTSSGLRREEIEKIQEIHTTLIAKRFRTLA